MGRNLIPYLLQHGDSVTALSRSDKADGIIKDAAASAGGKVSIVRGSLESDRAVLVEGTHCRSSVLVLAADAWTRACHGCAHLLRLPLVADVLRRDDRLRCSDSQRCKGGWLGPMGALPADQCRRCAGAGFMQ